MNRRLVLALLIVSPTVSSCGEDDGSTPSPTPTPTATQAVSSISTAIESALAAGSIPRLDTGPSVAGPDTNSNGIRDDIDSFINTLSDSEAGKASLRQLATAVQASLAINVSDQNALASGAQKITSGTQCVFSQYPEDTASDRVDDIEKYTVNTRERFLAYGQFNTALNGSVNLTAEGTGCAQ